MFHVPLTRKTRDKLLIYTLWWFMFLSDGLCSRVWGFFIPLVRKTHDNFLIYTLWWFMFPSLMVYIPLMVCILFARKIRQCSALYSSSVMSYHSLFLFFCFFFFLKVQFRLVYLRLARETHGNLGFLRSIICHEAEATKASTARIKCQSVDKSCFQKFNDIPTNYSHKSRYAWT